MQSRTFRYVLCTGLLALCCQASLADDKTPTPNSTVKRACADPNPATKKECEKVAAKIEAQSTSSTAQPAAEEAQSGADYVQHSSPAVRTPAEVAKDKEQAKSERKADSKKPEPK